MTSLPILAIAAFGAHAGSIGTNDFEIPGATAFSVPEAVYEGLFDAPPVAHWSVRLPGGRLASGSRTERTRPVVVGGNLLVGSAAGDALYLLSRRDGSLLRSYPADGSVESEAIVADGRVYFSDTAGSTWCYELDGTLVWRHAGIAPVLVRPTLDGDHLYVTDVDDLTVSLDAATGDLSWRYRRPPDLTRKAELALFAATPALLVEGQVLVGFSDGSLVALDAEKGEESWSVRVGEGLYPDLVAAPLRLGGDLLVSGYFTPFVAVDTETRNVRWRLEYGAAASAVAGPDAESRRVFHPGTDGVLRAVVALTGAEIWSWDSSTSGALTEPALTPAGILVASSDSGVFLVDPEDGREIWRYHEDVRLTGVTSAPTIAGRQLLFVSNAGFLHSMIVPKRHANHAPAPSGPFRRRIDSAVQPPQCAPIDPGEPRSPYP